MVQDQLNRPRLRAISAHPHDGNQQFYLTDPTKIGGTTLSVSAAALRLIELMDGSRSVIDIAERGSLEFGERIAEELIWDLVCELDRALLLESPTFEAHYAQLQHAFQSSPTRMMGDLRGMGFRSNDVSTELPELLNFADPPKLDLTIRGIIAPHLDFPRGKSCYELAYGAIRGRKFKRFVILGTNHFGLSSSAVACARPFATPLGVSECDLTALEQIESRCGSLRAYELDHKHEHSIELQVLLLQHLFGADTFSILPVLCPSPCGPTGTRPASGEGPDLADFVVALSELIAEDQDTCLIAAADLSHVGSFFGGTESLSDDCLEELASSDNVCLTYVSNNDATEFRTHLADNGNPTRICSAGCIYTILSALSDCRVQLLHYHQANLPAEGCCVTCCAATIHGSPTEP